MSMSPCNKSGLRTPKPLRGFGARSLKRYMPRFNPFWLILILSFMVVPSGAALACQYSGNSNELADAVEARQEMRRLVEELKESADTIFIGDIATLTDSEATFEDIVVIKGRASETDRFIWHKAAEKWIGCSGLVDFRNIEIEEPEVDEPQAHLIYAKQGTIIRANKVGTFAPSLSGYEEIEWLRE